jgi:methylglutaconyl-CoA hydratase
MTGQIDLEMRDDGIAILWINNPEHRNAFNDKMIQSMIEQLRSLDDDEACRVIALRGRDGILCAGRELRELRKLADASLEVVTANYEKLHVLNTLLSYGSKPTVAIVERYAFGAGATLTSWCDIAIAEEGAQIGYPEVQHGFAPSPAVKALLNSVGEKKAMDLILTGRRILAPEAERIGLLSRVVPADQLDNEVEQLFAGLLRAGPMAQEKTRAFVRKCSGMTERVAMATAVDNISVSLCTPQAREGITAFFEKRLPNWVRRK